ncbi:MAG TPA: nuclear transport factor 2 family protein, partial [Gammaproteobacteria bacterium]|nr:nuclear transport factor 2 family protein [Gammaproteobacteria bacterium]
MALKRSLARAGLIAALCVFGACERPVPESVGERVAAPAESSQAHRHLAALLHRAELIEDANDIKRLQRAYGYYVDDGQWGEVVDLFADDAEIEFGLDGIYVGKDRIREYFVAAAGGRTGLEPGRINEHMQLMPVVSVAADGHSAKARWREVIMAGRLGGYAAWGEGPFENEYVKQDGKWKFSKVYWHQAVVAPYEGGWQVHADPTGGNWVSGEIRPDKPPTIEYELWPGTFLPPFHFPNPVLGAVAKERGAQADMSAVAGLDPAALADAAAQLAHKVTLLEDENAIENLQRVYGFYVDKGFWSQAASLFAEDATIEVAGSGVYAGRDRVLEYLRSRGPEFPQEGRLFDRMQLQPIVHVAPDGRTALGRWRLFAQEAQHGEFAHWGVGTYENEYVKEGGVWKIRSLRVHHKMYTDYEDGWGVAAIENAGPSAELPPDRPPSFEYAAYPNAVPFPPHYENPVTGAAVFDSNTNSYAGNLDEASLEAALGELAGRIERLEDLDALERLNAVYGYYLAHSQWDNLAGIFAPEGSIEIAMRGIYVGRDSVRRNLDLYTPVGMQHGLLHNHMQYQPVITLAAGGQSALMRSRAFSMMGQHEVYSMWMGGIYENRYVKIDGVWQIDVDRQINTYFAPYAQGWRDLAPRPPPQ